MSTISTSTDKSKCENSSGFNVDKEKCTIDKRMREENQPNDGIKRSKGKFDPFKETRQWSAAASEERCQRIARNKGKRLVEIIDTEDEPLGIICIFED